MRRRSHRRHAIEPSLFPFLAVLICTMGALVVLLVVVVQQARVHAKEIVRQREAGQESPQIESVMPVKSDEQIEAEVSAWRVDMLKEQRKEVLTELADQRERLTHLEQHIRELEQAAEKLKLQLQALDSDPDAPNANVAAQREELRELQRQLEVARQQFEQARQAAANREPAFAILPFEGKNGTSRRPIYLECTGRGVVLQPENIVLRREDFEGPLGPGNPLDAALRTIRSYWREVEPGDARDPYPLLVVRPSGVQSYAMARAAVAAWDDEFGYELIEEDIQLAYPAPDSRLGEQVRRAIEDARDRQRHLMMAMPGKRQGGGFVVTAHQGGVIPLDARGDGSGVGSGLGGNGVGEGRSFRELGQRQQDAALGATGEDRSSEPSGATSQPSGQAAPAGQESGGSGGAGGRPLAEMRGANWALPGKGVSGTGYRRPIRILCFRDELVLPAEAGDAALAVRIPLTGNSTRAVDQLMEALDQRMDGWGLAPLGGYWRPQLNVQLFPGAEEQWQRIDILLRGSGLEIQRTQR